MSNPPWERIKLQEEEFFATRNRFVAEAQNKSERGQRIDWLAQGLLAHNLYPELDDGKMPEATGQTGQNVNFAVNGQCLKFRQVLRVFF